MKQNNLILAILLFISSSVIAQSYSEDNKKFIYKDKFTYEISEVETDSKYGLKSVLKIKKVSRNELFMFKTIDLPEKYDTDLMSFGEYIDKTRKFILIRARYSFYILNLYNNKLLGPFKPKFLGIGQDAQSGMITDLKIIFDGRFLVGYSVDSGGFLIDLTYLYQAKEIMSVNHPLLNQNHIYILKHSEKEDKSFGLFLKTEGWKIYHNIIFSNKTVNFQNYDHLNSISSEEIEDLIIEDNQVKQKYCFIKESISGNAYRYLIISNKDGKFQYIPKNINTDKEKIITYLMEK